MTIQLRSAPLAISRGMLGHNTLSLIATVIMLD
jgi:hypothetical protein